MCYNIVTSYSPPLMGTGGFEPPRQLSANSFQSYRACQLHHVPDTETQGEGSLPDRPSPKSPNINDTPDYGDLSSSICGCTPIILEKSYGLAWRR
jgi:hypothetical protein